MDNPVAHWEITISGLAATSTKLLIKIGGIGDDFNWTSGGYNYQFGIQQTRYYTTGLQQAGGYTPFGTFNFEPQETGLPG